ncbi:hypothetical protein GGR58DRAFT_66195 [Xylaria digitata]|nr:hypothetical protein GGR58DRAFT_66195 [Xylaria digitata]
MDPISALGAASSILQFVQFTGALISTTSKIYTQGASPDTLKLEDAVSLLYSLSTRLENPPSPAGLSLDVASIAQDDRDGLLRLSTECQNDCKELLRTLKKIQIESSSSNRFWKSVNGAIKANMEAKRIAQIEQRLGMAQLTMILLVGNILRTQISNVSFKLDNIKRGTERLAIDQSSKMDAISQQLEQLKLEIPKQVKNSILDDEILTHDIAGSPDSQPQKTSNTLTLDQLQSQQDKLRRVFEIEDELWREQSLLATFDFETRLARFEGIPEVYATTFEWAFQSDLFHWLRNGSGIF